jgi:hypothetical protein
MCRGRRGAPKKSLRAEAAYSAGTLDIRNLWDKPTYIFLVRGEPFHDAALINADLAQFLVQLRPDPQKTRIGPGLVFATLLLCALGLFLFATGEEWGKPNPDSTTLAAVGLAVMLVYVSLLFLCLEAAVLLAVASLLGWNSVCLPQMLGFADQTFLFAFPVLAAAWLILACVGYGVIRYWLHRRGRPICSPACGWVVSAVGMGLLISAGSSFLIAGTPPMLGLMTLPWIGVGRVVLGWGATMRSKDAFTTLREDSRAPVFYLRNFRRDVLRFAKPSSKERVVSVEEELCCALQAIGPVIAIGRPGDKLAFRGAARFYVSDAQWQEAALRVMKESALVVLFVGESASLGWEVRTSVANIDPRRLVIYVPTLSRMSFRLGAYDSFRRKFEALLPGGLPPHIGVASFIAFDKEWRPFLLPNGGKVVPDKSDLDEEYMPNLVSALARSLA